MCYIRLGILMDSRRIRRSHFSANLLELKMVHIKKY